MGIHELELQQQQRPQQRQQWKARREREENADQRESGEEISFFTHFFFTSLRYGYLKNTGMARVSRWRNVVEIGCTLWVK
jgi:hypothetical protein